MGSPSVRPSVREALLARNGHGHRSASASLTPAQHLLRQSPGTTLAPSINPSSARQLPLTNATVDVPVDPDRSPLEVWYAVEDLWLRLAAGLPVHVDTVGPAWRLVIQGFRQAHAGRMQDLRPPALDADLFTWRLDGRRGAFVQAIAYDGDDLVFCVTAPTTIERWPQGEDLGWQVRGLLDRLRMPGQAPLAGAAS